MILNILGIVLDGFLNAGNALTPRLVGQRVNLSPLLVMFAIAAFGYLFGFIGLLIAVPLAATIGVIVRFVVSQDLEHSLGAADVGPPNLPPKKRRWWI